MKIDSNALISQILSDMQKNVPYPEKLPKNLQSWHCYPIDCGHSILAILESAYLQDQPLENSLLPIPVKTVLAGYTIKDGFVFCTNPEAKYSTEIGLECPQLKITVHCNALPAR